MVESKEPDYDEDKNQLKASQQYVTIVKLIKQKYFKKVVSTV
jgi:hypothetical protein